MKVLICTVATLLIFDVLVRQYKRRKLLGNPLYQKYMQMLNDITTESQYIHMTLFEVNLATFASHTRDKNYAIKAFLKIENRSITDLLNKAEEISQGYIIDINEIQAIEKQYIRITIGDIAERIETLKTVDLQVIYNSPAGRSRRKANFQYDLAELKNLDIRDKQKECSKDERNKLTPKLRYKILSRDNYTCQYCGAQAKDGVKLHVDHIKPISKGGLTTEDNLITACETCNLGKGADYNAE